MRISEELKDALIVDVEVMTGKIEDEEIKEMLKRCFEITIGTRLKELREKED